MEDRWLLLEIVRALVESPQDANVEEQALGNGTSHLVIKVAPHDRGKVIGKSGRIAEAIRTIFMSVASLEGRRVFIEIDEPREARPRRPFRESV